VVVLVVAAPLLLLGLDGESLRPWDEGLYGKLARNALAHDRFLYPVDRDGTFYEAFSKPPLSFLAVAASFRGLGESMVALRLPFALCMLATVGVAFAWGRRIAGLACGVAWAGILLTSAASARWGRVACIEPMLALWILTALWAYHEAVLRRGRAMWGWSLVAAVALGLAVATKQVVVGLAVLPIVGLELWRWSGRGALARLALVLGVPTAVGLGWLWAVISALGEPAIEIYVRFGVLRRMQGYRSGLVQRSLNELSGVVAEATDPFPWVLGVAGLLLLALSGGPLRRRDPGSVRLLLPMLWLTTVLVFEGLSGSMLPWYAYDLVVPLTGGMAYLVAGLLRPSADRLGTVRATGGALTLAVGAIGALEPLVSQLAVVVVAAGVVVVAWHAGAPWLARARTGAVAAGGLMLLAGIALRPELRWAPSGHEQLMPALAAQGIERVDVSADAGLTTENAWGTYYGPGAQRVTRSPWRSHSGAQAYVTSAVWPLELPGSSPSAEAVQVIRGPGVMALVGDLQRPPWSTRTLSDQLDAGPLTFEAEHLPGQREGTVLADPRASGGHARAVVLPRDRPREPFVLAHGPGLRLPAGTYRVDFVVRWDCGAIEEKTAAEVQVRVGRRAIAQQPLVCPGSSSTDDHVISLHAPLPRGGAVELWVTYQWGDLWFDRVELWRSE